jgi:serine/threonine protein kinase
MVLKRCNIDREEVFEIVKKEINILRQFTGPYVTKLIESDIQHVGRTAAREALLLMEYYPGGHLLNRLNARHGQQLPAESIYRIFGQILMGVRGFHEANPPIINRDFKLENILFGTVKTICLLLYLFFSFVLHVFFFFFPFKFIFFRMVKSVFVTLAVVKSPPSISGTPPNENESTRRSNEKPLKCIAPRR